MRKTSTKQNWRRWWRVVGMGVALVSCTNPAPPPPTPTSPSAPALAAVPPTAAPSPSPTYIPATPAPTATPWADPCPANALYAAPTGHDETGDGSAERPFYSVGRATAQAQAGQTICVRGGVYTAAREVIIATGTAEQPLVIRPYQGETVIFDGTGAELGHTDSIILIRNSAHVRFEGFEVRNSSGRGISVYEGESITVQHNAVHGVQTRAIGGGGNNITFAYNHIWDAVLENENNAYNAQGGWAGALASYGREDGSPSTNITIVGNNIHDVWGEGIIALRATGVVVTDNTVRDAYSVNLYIDKVSNGRFERNYLFTTSEIYNRADRAYPANGITIANEGAQPDHPIAEDLVIANNLIMGTGYGINYWHYPFAPGFAGNTYRNITVAHNVILHTQRTAISFDEVPALLYDAPSGVILVNNIIFAGHNGRALEVGNPEAWEVSHNVWPDGLPESPTDPTGLVVDPAFTAPIFGGAVEGYELAATSVVAGRGTAVPEALTDYAQRPRSTTQPTPGLFEP